MMPLPAFNSITPYNTLFY